MFANNLSDLPETSISRNVQQYWFYPYVLDTHRQDSWSQLNKGIFHTTITYHITLDILCLAYKGRGRRKEGAFGVVTFFFPNYCYVPWVLFSRRWLNKHLPAHRKLWINSLFLFVSVCGCCLTSKLSFSQSMRFLTSMLAILSPCHQWVVAGYAWAAVWGWATAWG